LWRTRVIKGILFYIQGYMLDLALNRKGEPNLYALAVHTMILPHCIGCRRGLSIQDPIRVMIGIRVTVSAEMVEANGAKKVVGNER